MITYQTDVVNKFRRNNNVSRSYQFSFSVKLEILKKTRLSFLSLKFGL